MSYEQPEIFRIGRIEAHTFGGGGTKSQDSCDEYREKHEGGGVAESFRKACAKAAEV